MGPSSVLTSYPDHPLFTCWKSYLMVDPARAQDLYSRIGHNVTESLHNVWDEYQALLLVINDTDQDVIPAAGSVMANRFSAFQVKELMLRASQIRRFLEFGRICPSDIARRFPRTDMHVAAIVFQVAFSHPFGNTFLQQPCVQHQQHIRGQSAEELRSLLTAEQARLERAISLVQWTLETLTLAPRISSSATSATGGQLLQAAIEMAANIADTSVTPSDTRVITADSSAGADVHERPPSTRPETTCSHYDDDIDWLERLVEDKCVIEPQAGQGRLDSERVVAAAVVSTPREVSQVPTSTFGPAATKPVVSAAERPSAPPAQLDSRSGNRPSPQLVPPPPTRRPPTNPSTVTSASGGMVVLQSTRSVRRPLPHIVRKPVTPTPALAAVPGIGSGADEASVMRSCVSMP